MLSPATASDPPKKKRAPGRPKAPVTYDATIQVRLASGQLTQLDQQAEATGLSRSAIIRAALAGVQVLRVAPEEALREERRQQYRQLVKLATNLNQLVVLARTAPVVEMRARATIDQVQQVLAKIYQTLPDA